MLKIAPHLINDHEECLKLGQRIGGGIERLDICRGVSCDDK